MELTFYCPSCAKKYRVDEKLAGRKAPCKACGATMRVPGESELAPPEFVNADAADAGDTPPNAPNPLLADAPPPKKKPHHPARRNPTEAAKTTKPDDRPRKRIVIPGEEDVGEYFLKEELEPWAHNAMKKGGACPDCGKEAKAKSQMCVGCGLNFKTGEKPPPAQTAVEAPPPPKKRFFGLFGR